MGAALIPNKPIYRKNDEDEYYIYFSKDTVRKASELFFIRGNQNNSTLEHNVPLTGLTAVESWIVEDEKDKTRFYGLDVPMGTWMLSMKVQNDEVWNDYVKSGKVKGFSIEGYFADKLERPNEPKKDMSKEEIAEAKIEELKQLFSNHKVNLTINDDINSLLDKAFNLYDVQSELIKAQDKVKKGKDLYEQALKISQKGLSTAKELGASDFIKLMNDKIQISSGNIKGANSLINAIDKAITIL
jgi:hypothetical protein